MITIEDLVILPWQHKQWQQFCQQLTDHHLAHALLLAGPKGVGKQQLAHAFIARLLCHNRPLAPAIACNQCHSCLLRINGNHPDLFIVGDEVDRLIRIESIRAINDFIHETSQQNGYRIVLLKDADRMTQAAANALLKGLEEPGLQTQFILTSCFPRQLLATVISRCQKISCPAPANKSGLNWLMTQTTAINEIASYWQLAYYRPMAALVMLQEEQQQLRKTIQQAIIAISHGASAFSCAQHFTTQQILLFWQIQIECLENYIRVAMQVSNEKVMAILPFYQLPLLTDLEAKRKIFFILDYFYQQYNTIWRGEHLNVTLSIESAFIHWAQLLRKI